jgi:hypothetical protein
MKWVGRILGVVVGLVGIVIGLTTIFGENQMAECDKSEVLDTVRGLAVKLTSKLVTGNTDPEAVKKSVQLDDVAERSFDEEKQVRICSVKLSLRINNTTAFDKQKARYTMTWTDRKKGDGNVYLELE